MTSTTMHSGLAVVRGWVRDLAEGPYTLARLRAAFPHARVHTGVRLEGNIRDVDLAAGVTVRGPSALSVAHGGGLRNSHLRVGTGTFIGEFCNVRCGGAPITIGSRCLIGQQVSIVGSNHKIAAGQSIGSQDWDGPGVTIGDGAWIGAGAILLPGSRIGPGAVVAAGSVVRGEVDENTVVAGIPAAPVRMRS